MNEEDRADVDAQATKANLHNLITSNVDGMIVVDRQGTVRLANPAVQVLFGRSESELLHEPFGLPLVTGEATQLELLQSGGGKVPVEMRTVEVDWETKPAYLVTLRDLTGRNVAEKQQAQMAAVVNSTDDAVMSFNVDGILLSWNPAAERTFGYSVDEALGIHVSILWPLEGYKQESDILERANRGESIRHYESVALRKDGRTIEVSLSVSPIRSVGGDVVGIAVVARDITERKRAEQALRQSEERHRTLVHTIPHGIEEIDTEGVITFSNHGQHRMYGYAHGELLGKSILDSLATDSERQELGEYLKTVVKDQPPPCPYFVQIRRKDGRVIDVQVDWNYKRDDQGQLLGFTSVITDISALKRAEENRIKRLEAERQINIAREMQQSLFPARAPSLDEFDIAGAVFAADEASGDYYDFIPMADDTVGVAVGDVSGHGLGPALLMSQTQAHLRALVETHNDVSEILTRANRLFHGDTPGRFVTLLLACIDPRARTFVYASAGHRGYLLTAAGEAKMLDSTGTPLGLGKEMVITSAPVTPLAAGDLIVLTTDGIEEAQSPNGTLFGVENTLEVIRANRERPAGEIVQALYEAARDSTEGGRQVDDITAVVIKVLEKR